MHIKLKNLKVDLEVTVITVTNPVLIRIVAIESDRSTEFKVLCSAEQVKKMKERNQLESEKLKRKREKAEEEKRKYKDKVLFWKMR